jgi:hypothetical protein
VAENPEITRRTPDRITYIHRGPVQRVILEGENFLSEQGSVEFQLADRSFPAEVVEWRDNWIEVHVPEISGLIETTGAVVVRNRYGLEGRAGMTYVPMIVTRLLDSRNCDFDNGSGCNRGGERGSGEFDVTCAPNYGRSSEGVGEMRNDDPLWLICLNGQVQEFPTRITLYNGWTVYEAGYYRSGCYGWRGCGGWRGSGYRCGAYSEDPPGRGDRSIDHTNVIWTDAWAACEFREQIVIEGPFGVPHSRPYNPADGDCIQHPDGC